MKNLFPFPDPPSISNPKNWRATSPGGREYAFGIYRHPAREYLKYMIHPLWLKPANSPETGGLLLCDGMEGCSFSGYAKDAISHPDPFQIQPEKTGVPNTVRMGANSLGDCGAMIHEDDAAWVIDTVRRHFASGSSHGAPLDEWLATLGIPSAPAMNRR